MTNEQINDGGPAFPIPPVGTGDPRDGMAPGYDGMSLRDWFAGKALAGMIAKFDAPLSDDDALYYIAKRAVRLADAMLAAREEGA
jgi:hypothetical protein